MMQIISTSENGTVRVSLEIDIVDWIVTQLDINTHDDWDAFMEKEHWHDRSYTLQCLGEHVVEEWRKMRGYPPEGGLA
jgi:hypothetical protein